MADAKDIVNAIKELQKSIDGQKGKNSPAAQAATDKATKRGDLKEHNEQLKILLKLTDDENEKLEIKNQLQENNNELTMLSTRSIEKKTKALKDAADRTKKNNEAIKKNTEAKEKNKKADEAAATSGAGLATSMGNMLGVSNDLNNSLLGQAKAAFSSAEGFKSFGSSMQETFTLGNIGSSILSKGFETTVFYAGRLFTEMDSGLASFNAATGATGEYDKAITDASVNMVQYGVAVGDVAGAQAALMRSFPLRELGTQSTAISQQFALWQKSGVSIDVATRSYTTLRRSFKMTNDEALGLQKNIMALGDEIGVGGPKMIEDFAAAAPRLAIHGNNMEKVFKRVASASAQLGLEVDDVLSLAEGFQTFEGSAQAAGKLNSILGGGFVDNIQLMNAAFEDPAQAAVMIKDAFSAAGESVESLGPAGVKAAAAAAGFSDVGKFTSFLNGELDAAELAADEGLTIQKNMEAAAKSSLSTLESIDTSIKQLFSPLLPVMQNVASFIKGVPDNMKAAIILGAPVIGSLMLAGLSTVFGMPHAVMVGNTIAARIGPLMAGKDLAGGGSMFGGVSKFMKGTGGKLIKGAGLAAAGGMLAKDVYDVATGDANAENWGAIAGSVVGGTIGILGGPAGIALGASLGNMAGEALGKTFDESKKKADASMPEKKTAEQARHTEMMESIRKLAATNQDVKVKLEVDEYAYKKGFKLSTADVMSGR